MAYLLLYVDNIILLTASSGSLRQSILHRLSSEFAMKDLGPMSYFLGIEVSRYMLVVNFFHKRNMLWRL